MNAEAIIPAILMILGVSTFSGSFFAGFAIAGKRKDRSNYVVRGIFWSLLLLCGGALLLGALVFGACLLMISGMRF